MLKYRLKLICQNIVLMMILVMVVKCSFHTEGPSIDQGLERKKVLLVLDMQRDFVLPDGAYPIDSLQSKDLIVYIESRVKEYQKTQSEVVYVNNEFSPGDLIGNWFRNSSAIQGTPGAELVPTLQSPQNVIYTKSSPDAFSNEKFDQYLRDLQVTDIEIVGVYADQCVSSTIRGGQARGYQFHVNPAGLGASNRETLSESVKTMGEMGVQVGSEL